ncbi:hypothetical protein DCF50_p714 [Dehalobacter sp. CF]|nr:hypothetical protein DCF50_p714 [Dehalobacter sp. CF]
MLAVFRLISPKVRSELKDRIDKKVTITRGLEGSHIALSSH